MLLMSQITLFHDFHVLTYFIYSYFYIILPLHFYFRIRSDFFTANTVIQYLKSLIHLSLEMTLILSFLVMLLFITLLFQLEEFSFVQKHFSFCFRNSLSFHFSIFIFGAYLDSRQN